MARNEFRDIEEIRNPSGVVAVISERVADGRMSVAFFREYEIQGEIKRSSFVARRHLAGIRKLLGEVEIRLDTLEDEARMQRRMPSG